MVESVSFASIINPVASSPTAVGRILEPVIL
jgi:hypothetical protein